MPQLLTESLALCLFGGVAGVAVAYGLIRLAAPLLLQSLPFTADVSLNPDVLAFGVVIVLGVALLAGIFPALRASGSNLTDSLKQSTRSSSGGAPVRVRRAIVIGEIALSLVLVCGALLLARSLLKLQQLDPGVRIENITTASLDLPKDAYSTPQKAALFYEALVQRLHSEPGIAKVGLSTYLPLQWVSNGEAVQIAGAEKLVRVRFKRVDPGYFNTLDIPVLSGRGITAQDREKSPRIVVINQALAARLAEAGMSDPVGKPVRLSSTDYQGKPQMLEVQIAGMIRSERTASPGDADPAVVYVPLAQAADRHLKLLVRTRDGTASVVPAIREAVRAIDPKLPLGDVAPLQQVLDDTLAPASRPTWLIGAFACAAVLLATIGLYSLIAHSVTQQRREIGIRLALGAQSSEVLSQILRGTLVMVMQGILFGLLGTFALTRVMASLLFEVSPLDPFAVFAGCAAIVLIGLVAGVVPASRAARVDPATTLRDAG